MRKVLLVLALVLLVGASVFATGAQEMSMEGALSLTRIGTYETGIYDESAAEIVDYDPATEQLFLINANDGSVDVIGLSNPGSPEFLLRVPVPGGSPNSIAVKDGIVAVAIEAENSQAPGSVGFASAANGEVFSIVPVGPLPDMVTFSPNGRYVVTANEGEPNDSYTVDPVGSISIIDLSGGPRGLTAADVRTVSFENAPRIGNIRVNGPGASFAQDMEPEYVAIDGDSRFAYVALQENNAVAKVDIWTGSVIFVKSLGLKDHSIPGNGFDASDRDGQINIQNWPVFGMYMPDAMAAYTVNGETYLITANEGDGRDYDGFSDEADGADLMLDETVFTAGTGFFMTDSRLGRLLVSATDGDVDGDGLNEMIVSLGARSMTIWDSSLNLVADTGDEFEQIIAERYPDAFNINGGGLEFDNRSDNKGPEPEGVTVGMIGGRHYAFVGLERQSAVLVYDVQDPTNPRFVAIANGLDMNAPVDEDGEFLNPETAGDIGPEGLKFIPASESPNGRDLLIVANEVSGTVSIWQIR